MRYNIKPYPYNLLFTLRYQPFLDIERLCSLYKDLSVNHREETWYKQKDFEYNPYGVKLPDKVLNLSVNLLGGGFNDDDLEFKQEKIGMDKDWSIVLQPPEYGKDYTIIHGFKKFYFKVDDVRHFTFPYNCSVSDYATYLKFLHNAESKVEDDELVVKGILMANFTKPGSTIQTSARLKIVHRPTSMNYWHCQIEAFRLNDNSAIPESDKEFRKINRQCRRFIGPLINRYNNITYRINPMYYLRG